MIYCGIDIGSRTSKAILFSGEEKMILAAVIKDATNDHGSDARHLYGEVCRIAGIEKACKTVATGYGREMVDFADQTVTEISCQARGVLALFPQTQTVIDIGGQDSKVIHISAGVIRDFAMNDRCAAGTGRFLEVASRILETDVDGLSALARRADSTIDISSMCVVFAESEIIGMIARGMPRTDIAAGLFRAIARRIAGMVVRGRFESPVVFTGGVAKSPAMVSFLGSELQEKLIVPEDPRITGALGGALIASGMPISSIEGCQMEALKISGIPIRDSLVTACSGMTGPGVVCATEPQSPCTTEPQSPCTTEPQSPCTTEHKAVCADSQNTICTKDPNHRSPWINTVPALSHFDRMIRSCIDYATTEHQKGKKIVAIFCEYTPREIILAGGAVPVCACGGSNDMALAGERSLPSNLCPLIKSSFGFHLERANPIFEMSELIVAETTCDGKKKMYELLSMDKPMHLLELTQKPDQEMAFQHWLSEVRMLKVRMERLTGIEITDERLREAIDLMNRERSLRRSVAFLSRKGVRGSEILKAKSLISCIPEDFEVYQRIIDQAEALGPPAHKPGVLLTGVPLPHGAEKVITIIEESGAQVLAQENCTGLKPLLEDVSTEGDPLEAIARKYFHLECSCMTPNKGRFILIDKLVDLFKPLGVIDLIWQACHTYAVESELLKRHMEEVHMLPYLRIETDYSPSDATQIRLRVESFTSLIQASGRTGKAR